VGPHHLQHQFPKGEPNLQNVLLHVPQSFLFPLLALAYHLW
jgi:hypothetical protein